MINIFEVNETNKMITQENLDVRTITLGISLMDCIDSDLQVLNEKIYRKITESEINRQLFKAGVKALKLCKIKFIGSKISAFCEKLAPFVVQPFKRQKDIGPFCVAFLWQSDIAIIGHFAKPDFKRNASVLQYLKYFVSHIYSLLLIITERLRFFIIAEYAKLGFIGFQQYQPRRFFTAKTESDFCAVGKVIPESRMVGADRAERVLAERKYYIAQIILIQKRTAPVFCEPEIRRVIGI